MDLLFRCAAPLGHLDDFLQIFRCSASYTQPQSVEIVIAISKPHKTQGTPQHKIETEYLSFSTDPDYTGTFGNLTVQSKQQ